MFLKCFERVEIMKYYFTSFPKLEDNCKPGMHYVHQSNTQKKRCLQLVDEFLLVKAFLLHLLDLGILVCLLVLQFRIFRVFTKSPIQNLNTNSQYKISIRNLQKGHRANILRQDKTKPTCTWESRFSHSLISRPSAPWFASVFFSDSWRASICSFSPLIFWFSALISFCSPPLMSCEQAAIKMNILCWKWTISPQALRSCWGDRPLL